MGSTTTKKTQIKTEALAATLLLIVLAALTTLIIVETGTSYRSIVNTSGTSREIRTALNYVETEVRRTDGVASVRKSPLGGNAIVITQTVNSDVYEDWIFFYKNTLREVLIPSGTEIDPNSCQTISEIDGFNATMSGRTIRVTVSKKSDGRSKTNVSESIFLALRT